MTLTSGYSGTPLIRKLGLRETMKVCLLDPPVNYFELLGKNISSQFVSLKEKPDLVHVFAPDHGRFLAHMKKLESAIQLNPQIIIWVSWYKKSSGLYKDLSEDLIREHALHHDLVDIKVCAVSDVWSGLKLVVRKNKR
ncbi:MAG TPA: hypothetical protein VM012_03745 [Flavitalea sp.]|nr:hypothetical protein [Flavitalea sp.]